MRTGGRAVHVPYNLVKSPPQGRAGLNPGGGPRRSPYGGAPAPAAGGRSRMPASTRAPPAGRSRSLARRRRCGRFRTERVLGRRARQPAWDVRFGRGGGGGAGRRKGGKEGGGDIEKRREGLRYRGPRFRHATSGGSAGRGASPWRA